MHYMELLPALDLAYPVQSGWVRSNGFIVDDIELDAVFHHPKRSTVIALLMEQPYVSGADIKLAEHLKVVLSNRFAENVTITLVYFEMLARPLKVPLGISIIGLSSVNGVSNFESTTLLN